jgi:hypothetical protein
MVDQKSIERTNRSQVSDERASLASNKTLWLQQLLVVGRRVLNIVRKNRFCQWVWVNLLGQPATQFSRQS